MSRRAPTCAWCGQRLINRASMRLRYGAIPGCPEVGWHWTNTPPCAEQDPLRAVLWSPKAAEPRTEEIIATLRAIDARGGGRLSATLRWLRRPGGAA